MTFGGEALRNTRTVSIRDFFFYEVDVSSAKEWNQFRSQKMPEASPGDHFALVAMHVATKEMVDWTWSTFWWHDFPNRGKYGKGRPSTVRDEWAHYLMNVSYDMDLPRERDRSAHICFNPWLEGLFPGGHKSNCVTCHRLSVWPNGLSLPVTRGSLHGDHPLFMFKAKLDYLWSVARN